jgi:hypothetical protein
MRGDVEIITSDNPENKTSNRPVLAPESFVYHSSGRYHTLRAVGPEASQYVIFKWLPKRSLPEREPGTFIYHGDITESEFTTISEGFQILPINGLSNFTNGYLRSHFSCLEPGASYKTHRDEYDILSVLLEGKLQVFNQTISAPSFVYFAAGVPHSFYNPGELPARYYVFEFV